MKIIHLPSAALYIFIGTTISLSGPHVRGETGTGSLPAKVDLRPAFDQAGFARSMQGGRPTCSVFTMVGAIEYAIAKKQGRCERLSVDFLNWAANRAGDDRQDGGFFSDLWNGFEKYGICASSGMPYRPQYEPSVQPTTQALADAKTRLGLGLRLNWIKEWDVHTGLTEDHMRGIKRTLAEEWPVCAGLRWPKQEQWVETVLQMCPSNAVRDGHSVLLVGYRDEAEQPGGGVFIFRNTSNRGHDGFMPYAYARAYMNDAAWVDFKARATQSRTSTEATQGLADPVGTLGGLHAGVP